MCPTLRCLASIPPHYFPTTKITVAEASPTFFNTDLNLGHYLHKITEDLDHFTNGQTETLAKTTIHDFTQQLGVSIKVAQEYAETVIEEPATDAIDVATRPSLVAQKCVYLAFAATSAVPIARRNIELTDSMMETAVLDASMCSDKVEIVRIRAEVFRHLPLDIKRAETTIMFEADEVWIARDYSETRAVELMAWAKTSCKTVTWLAAMSSRLCIVAVANAMRVGEESPAIADDEGDNLASHRKPRTTRNPVVLSFRPFHVRHTWCRSSVSLIQIIRTRKIDCPNTSTRKL